MPKTAAAGRDERCDSRCADQRITEKRKQLEKFIGTALPRQPPPEHDHHRRHGRGHADGRACSRQWASRLAHEAFGLTSPAWQILCSAAAVLVLATVATQLLKSHNLEARHARRAAAPNWKFEVGLSTGQIE
jgi:hypothetical protein